MFILAPPHNLELPTTFMNIDHNLLSHKPTSGKEEILLVLSRVKVGTAKTSNMHVI